MGNRPTHRLVIKRKDKQGPGTYAGAAWTTEQGWLSIRLNPGIVLSFRDCDEHYMTLFPIDENYPARGSEGKQEPPDYGDDDIPF